MNLEGVGSDPAAVATRRSRLNGIKLRALVSDHLGTPVLDEPVMFAPGAALIVRRGQAAVGWVLLDDRPPNRLGAALAWALRAGVDELQVIAESGTGVLARRAAEFDYPISIWHAEQRDLLPVVAEPLFPPVPVPEHHMRFAESIAAAGADVVIEHGVLVGEVGGLEVCRVVDDRELQTTRLEVGVGVHDREAFAMLHGNEPAPDALARIVGVVARHRRLDAAPHPLNRLGRERLLRWHLLTSPEVVGAVSIDVSQPPIARANLKDPVPCVAIARCADGVELVVVCSVGADLDLVPYAADSRLAAGGGDRRLLLVTPARDRLPVIAELASLLRQPASFVALD